MRRREFLKAGLTLAALPLLGSLPSEPTCDDVMVPPEWGALIARGKARFLRAEDACEDALDVQLNHPSDARCNCSHEYLLIAAQGLQQPFAQWMLSKRYWEGWRSPKRPDKAIELCHQAANAGEPLAQIDLALRYGDGYGVPRDLARADAWWDDAAEGCAWEKEFWKSLAPQELDAWHRVWEAYLQHIDSSNRNWKSPERAEEWPSWNLSVGAQPMVDMARLHLSFLRAKRLSRPLIAP